MSNTTKPAADKNVEAVIAKMRERAAAGLKKYGVTTERKDVSLLGWLKHGQQEAMDLTIYFEAAIQEEENRLRKTRKRKPPTPAKGSAATRYE